MPHLVRLQDYSDPLEDDDVNEFLPTVERIPPNYSAEFDEFAEIIMTNEGLEMPADVKVVLICIYFYL